MQYDLREADLVLPQPPGVYQLHAWRPELVKDHAEAKFRSFRHELDTNVFACLGDAEGCLQLMKEISGRKNFLPETTWLLTHVDPSSGRQQNVGTVQGLLESADVGSIQNVGVVTGHRGMGLGALLIQYSLFGFRESGVKIVTLEVTEKNTGAMRLYQRLGFRILRTVYKPVKLTHD